MLRIAKGKNLTWYDVESPAPEDIGQLKRELKIHPIILDELIPQVRHPKLDMFGSHLFLVLTIPLLEKNSKNGSYGVRLEELDIVFGSSWIVTSHYRPLPAIGELFSLAKSERNSHIEYLDNENPATLIYAILSRILRDTIASLGVVEERIDGIERSVFSERQRELVHELSELRHTIIDFRRALSPSRPVFRALDDAGPALLGTETFPYFRNLTGRIEQIATLISTMKETVEALVETNQALLTTRTNDTVRLFTVLTALLLPPALVTSIFSMNLQYPFEISQNAFWLINVGALTSVIAPWLYFKKRKWL